MPLLDDSAKFITSDIHAVEVGVAIEALNFLDLHLHLSPSLLVAVSVQISQRYLKHMALKAVCRLLLASSSVAGGDCRSADIENGGHVDIVPFLLLESMLAIFTRNH